MNLNNSSHRTGLLALRSRRLTCENLEPKQLLTGEMSAWHNPGDALDVNRDGVRSPIDALLIVNELNGQGARELTGNISRDAPKYIDVNNDRFVSPLDALLVINDLNSEGENETVRFDVDVTDMMGNVQMDFEVGDLMLLSVSARDIQDEPTGVFAAYLDVAYGSQVEVVLRETQSIGVSGLPMGGSFTLTFDGETTADIPFDASASTVRAALTDLSNVGDNDMEVIRLTNSWEVKFGGTLADQDVPNMVVDDSNVIGGSLSVSELNTGVAGTPGSFRGSISFSPLYPNGRSAFDATNELNEIGGFDGDVPFGGSEVPVFSAHFRAISPGSVNFVGGPADDSPIRDVLLFGTEDSLPEDLIVPTDEILYGSATIAVAGDVGQAPVAIDDTGYSVEEDSVINTTAANGVLTNDSDPDSDTLTAQLVSNPANGTVALNGTGSFVYTPNANFNGTDSFTYRASDGTFVSNDATITIVVNPVNDLPIGAPDNYNVLFEGSLSIEAEGVLSNDSDIDGDTLTVSLGGEPTNGTLDLASNGGFTYTPNLEFSGTDSFTYLINDGSGADNAASEPVTVNITVLNDDLLVDIDLVPTNQFGFPISSISVGTEFLLQVQVEDLRTNPEGVFAAYLDLYYSSDILTVSGDIIKSASYPNDVDGNTSTPGFIDELGAFDGLDPLGSGKLVLLSVPFTASSTGTVNFNSEPAEESPAHDVLLFNGIGPVPVDRIGYGSATLNIVNPVAPNAANDSYETDEDVVLQVAVDDGVLANDTDGNDDLVASVLVSGPSNGTLVLNLDGSFVYTPALNFNGTDSFTYRASDGLLNSSPATVVITVVPVEDAPVANDDSYLIVESEPFSVSADEGVLQNDSDPEGDNFVTQLVTETTEGTVALNSDGSFIYTSNDDFIGTDSFTYRAVSTDDTLVSEIATVTLTVGDLTPGNISGYVYTDANGDGVMGTSEPAIGGVTVTLVGTDILGNEVNLSDVTGGDGAYSFSNVMRGYYELIETQPGLLVDGPDTSAGGIQLSPHNDRFSLVVPSSADLRGYNFGELGLPPQFVGNNLFFASNTQHGLLAVVNTDGETEWYCFDPGWEGFQSANVQLSSNLSVTSVTVVDNDGDVFQAILPTAGPNVMVVGSTSQGTIVRILGTPSQLNLQAVEDHTDPEADAVDAAFADYA